jgi:hypothetical protein
VDVPPGETLPLLDPNHQLNPISRDELPKCPACKVGLQRPGVVWFGEKLDDAVLERADDFVNKEPVVSNPLPVGPPGCRTKTLTGTFFRI